MSFLDRLFKRKKVQEAETIPGGGLEEEAPEEHEVALTPFEEFEKEYPTSEVMMAERVLEKYERQGNPQKGLADVLEQIARANKQYTELLYSLPEKARAKLEPKLPAFDRLGATIHKIDRSVIEPFYESLAHYLQKQEKENAEKFTDFFVERLYALGEMSTELYSAKELLEKMVEEKETEEFEEMRKEAEQRAA